MTQPDEEEKVTFENTMTEVHLRLHKAKPYQKVIEMLKQLKEVKQPYSAMKLIRKAKNLIPECIDEFWQDVPVDPNLLQLDAEQINAIMAYVVMKAGMADLMGQIRLIEEFTSEDQQESKEGQAFYTLKIAAELIKDQHYEFQEVVAPEIQTVSRQ